MANAVTIFDNPPELPAEMEAFFNEESNVVPRETINSLSYGGKNWAIVLDGVRKVLTRKNAEGDEEPVPIMRVVILDYNKRRGRAYYPGAYDPEKVTMPECWSDDGITPSEYVKEPYINDADQECGRQSTVCAKCPMSIKGSKVTGQGKSVVACSEHRMIAVIPAQRLDFKPLRMKIAITSDWDGQSPDHEAANWYAFSNYIQYLISKGVKHTAKLVTKMRFDPNADYPKVLFSTDKLLEADQVAQVIPIVRSEEVKALISGTWAPNGTDAVKLVETTAAEPVADDEVAAARAKKATAQAVVARAAAAAKAKADAEAAAAEAAALDAAAAEAVAEDEDDVELPGDTPPAKAPIKAPAKSSRLLTAEEVKATTKTPTKVAAKVPMTRPASPTKAPAKTKAPSAEEPADAEEPAADTDESLSGLLEDWS